MGCGAKPHGFALDLPYRLQRWPFTVMLPLVVLRLSLLSSSMPEMVTFPDVALPLVWPSTLGFPSVMPPDEDSIVRLPVTVKLSAVSLPDDVFV